MSKIQVYLKLKPHTGASSISSSSTEAENPKVITQSESKDNAIEVVTSKEKDATSTYTFDKVFDEKVPPVSMYSQILHKPIQELILKQHDTTFFTLGPSNSGKSYSLFGKNTKGILSYALKDLFEQMERLNGPDFDVSVYHEILGDYFGGLYLSADDIVDDPKKRSLVQRGLGAPPLLIVKNTLSTDTSSIKPSIPHASKQVISLSMYEIYNDSIIDLLELTKDYSFLKKQIRKQATKSTEIFTDPKDGKTKPANIFTVSVSSLKQAMLLIDFGLKKRHVASTNINSQSSRSHLFISVNMHTISLKDQSKSSSIKPSFSASGHKSALTHKAFPGKHIKIKTSRLTIADVAGAERSKAAQTASNKTAFLEGNSTNQSLTELGRVLNILSKSKNKTREKSLIRTDKLTRLLLSDYIGNTDNKMMVLVNLNPYGDIYTIASTLRLVSPLPQFKNSHIDSHFNKTRLSAFNFKLNFRSKEIKALHPTTTDNSTTSSRPPTPTVSSPGANIISQNNGGSMAKRSGAVSVQPTPKRADSTTSIASSKASAMPASTEPSTTIALRRLSMVQKVPPSPISTRVTSGLKKKSNTSPLVESFTASGLGYHMAAQKLVRNNSPTTAQKRAHSSPIITRAPTGARYTHKTSFSISHTDRAGNNAGFVPESRKESTPVSTGSKNGSWPSTSALTSVSHTVENYLKSLGFNITDATDKSQIIEKIVLRCHTMSDENTYLRERNQLLEDKLEHTSPSLFEKLEAQYKDHAQQMATDLVNSKIEMDKAKDENKRLNDKIKALALKLAEAVASRDSLKQQNQNLNAQAVQLERERKKEVADLKKLLGLANEETAFLKNELQLANEDLESIKQKFTVIAFQNREYQEQISKIRHPPNSNSNSDSTIEAPKERECVDQRDPEKINSFYFANFSFSSTFHDNSMDSDNPDTSNIKQISPNRYLVGHLPQISTTKNEDTNDILPSSEQENLTSNSSTIVDYEEPSRDKNNLSSINNTQYDSETETHTKINFSMSPNERLANAVGRSPGNKLE